MLTYLSFALLCNPLVFYRSKFYYPPSGLFHLSFSMFFPIPHDDLASYFLAINCRNTPSSTSYLYLHFCLLFVFCPVLEGEREWWKSLLLSKFYSSVILWNIFSLISIKRYLTNYSLFIFSFSLCHLLLPLSLMFKSSKKTFDFSP